MTGSPDIVILGSTNVDLIFRVEHLPKPGETVLSQAFEQQFGGKGGNQAVVAARLGAETALISRVGADDYGTAALRHYLANKVPTLYIGQDETAPTGLACITVDARGNNAIVVAPGANLTLRPEHVLGQAHLIASARLIIAQLEIPMEAIIEAFRLARGAGAATMLNAAPALAMPDELLGLTDVCIVNEPEVEQLTGQAIVDQTQVKEIAQALRRMGPSMVVVTLGANGAWIEDDSLSMRVPALKVNAVDTTGAGDAFTAAFGVAFCERRPPLEAVRWANRVAALTVARPGTQSSFPNRWEVDTWNEPGQPG